MKRHKKGILLVLVLVLFTGFAMSGCVKTPPAIEEETDKDNDTAYINFSDPSQVGVCYGDMIYPFDELQNFVQVRCGSKESSPICFVSAEDNKMTLRMTEESTGLMNVCIRIYSDLFKDCQVGAKVRVTFKMRIDPDYCWTLFYAYLDENYQERIIKDFPKSGEFATIEYTTHVSNSSAFHKDSFTKINEKNVGISFFRLTMGDWFEIDSINFYFTD